MKKALTYLFVHLFVIILGIPSILLAQEAEPYDGMLFNEVTHNFGIVDEEKGPVSHTFTFTNRSDKPLVVVRVTTDCGCTTPEYTTQAVNPGEKGYIKVTFNPQGRVGTFIKNIRVFNNELVEPVNLQIRGNVSSLGGGEPAKMKASLGPLRVTASYLSFPLLAPGRQNAVRVVLYNDNDFSIEARIVSLPQYVHASEPIISFGPHEPIELHFIAAPDSSAKPSICDQPVSIALFKDGQALSTEQLWLHMAVAPSFEELRDVEDMSSLPLPQSSLNTWYDLGEIALGKPYEGKIEVANVGKKPLAIYSIYCKDKAIDLKVDRTTLSPGEKTFIRYRLLLPEARKFSENIEILTNDPQAPLRKVKIIAQTSK